MQPSFIPTLLGLAVLLPLLSFLAIFLLGPYMGKRGVHAGPLALGAILSAGILSFLSLFIWLSHHPLPDLLADHSAHGAPHDVAAGEHAAEAPEGAQAGEAHTGAAHTGAAHAETARAESLHTGAAAADSTHGQTEQGHGAGHAGEVKPAMSGVYYPLGLFRYTLGQFGDLELTISYYVDSLTIVMFCVVTLIASCIHLYAMGYMHDELHEVTDHEVTLSDGHHFHRPGRYYRFFQYLSLFCFSMLGLVLSGNLLMIFVFWELVGICSYFLIGFYYERKSASNAANKAFIVNRVGDFGMLIGLMIFWTGLGTFSFGSTNRVDADGQLVQQPGIFELVRPEGELVVPSGLVRLAAQEEIAQYVAQRGGEATLEQISAEIETQLVPRWREQGYGYWLLIIGGIGIFCGCVGKSAQFPLHVWLPDAMEGPTPVSALVHSATMVAAGVYLVGRFFPVFAPEVLLVIATIGAITLFLAASIAITATDIKRVLAYSTVSQLGYMMLALGVGGWLAGMFHLVTHAFFKSLLFLCSGSVIHAVHTNEMPLMGGLRKKMPITAYTMLVGCLAIAGAGVPFVIGLSGYYSKDAILEQAFSFMRTNATTWGTFFFLVATAGAAITAFYMFRLWYLTFAGEPRDHHRYDHAHESPRVMTIPLLILAVLAVVVAWQPFNIGPIRSWTADESEEVGVLERLPNLGLIGLLEQARPAGTLDGAQGRVMDMTWPNEHESHAMEIRGPVTILAFLTALAGFGLATLMYALGKLRSDEVVRQFRPVYRLLVNKWWFDELYHGALFRPTHWIARSIAAFDRRWIDGFIDGTALVTRRFAVFWERVADQGVVDGLVNTLARWTYSTGVSFRTLQTGNLRQYVMFIVIGAVALFLLVSFFWSPTLATWSG